MPVQANIHKLGNIVPWTPSGPIVAGTPTDLGNLAGVPPVALSAGVEGSMQIRGHFAIVKDAGVFVPGEPVYFDLNGSPVGGVALSGAATRDVTAGDFFLGRAVCDALTGDTHVIVDLNSELVEWPRFPANIHEKTAVNKTLDAEDMGKVMHATADGVVVTLPATAPGLRFIVVNDGADGEVGIAVSPDAVDKIMGPDIAGVDDKDAINTKTTAKKGDFIILVADGSLGWYIEAKRGVWAMET